MSKIDFLVTVIFDANDYSPEQKDKAKEDLVHVCENLECIKLPNGACGISFPILNDGKKGTKPYDIKDFDYDNGEPIVSVSHLIAHCVSNGDVMQVGVNEKADLFVRTRMEETWKVVEYTFRGWKPTLKSRSCRNGQDSTTTRSSRTRRSDLAICWATAMAGRRNILAGLSRRCRIRSAAFC